jgi:TP901 family phage tail tape measure protein
MLGITAVIGGMGFAAYKAGQKFDDALDTIRVGTGATGKALDGLNESFKAVFTTVPTSAAQASTAIADLNNRLGLTGAPLEGLSAQMLNLARITKSDVAPTIAATTRVFVDWGIATDKQSSTLDYLSKVSQSTGIGVNGLSQKVVQFGAPLRQMGFDLQASAALLGKFEKEGVNAELVMGSLRIALTKMSKAGITDASAALKQIVQEIQNAGSTGQANAKAVGYFASRAGPDMAAAIREGRISISELVKETSQAIRRQLAAMPCDLYLIRLIHHATKRPFPGERLWTAVQLSSVATVRFFQHSQPRRM